jgi:serine/threonine protein kinase
MNPSKLNFRVKLAQNPEGEKVALKITSYVECTDEAKEEDSFFAEVNCLNELDHPNIIKLKDFSERALIETKSKKAIEVSYMALEYGKRGELFNWVTKTGRFSEEESRFFFHQLVDVLEYLHSNGYYHRDIKPENMVLDENLILKLVDFGFATKEKTLSKSKGTTQYLAPEILSKKAYKWDDQDLFALAVSLFNIVTQQTPFLKAEKEDSLYRFIVDGDCDQFWRSQKSSHLSKDFKDLFEKMVNPNPSKRLSLKDIKEHPWYKGETLSVEEMKNRLEERIGSEKKCTQLFKTLDNETLIKFVAQFWDENGYAYTRSSELYQLEINVNSPEFSLNVVANVMKKPKKDKKLIELNKTTGDSVHFEEFTDNLKEFLKTQAQDEH